MTPHKKNALKILGAVAVAFLMLPVFSTNDVQATASSLSIALSGSPTINLPPTADGKFADSGNVTITVTTTHAAGYALSAEASGSSNPTSLNTSGGTVGFQTIGTSNDCPSGINASSFDTSDCNGYWGYKPSVHNSVDNTTNNYYFASPTVSGDPLDTTSDGQSRTYTVSIGARADINTAMESYSNTFTFAVVANATPYTLTYADNSGEATGMPANITDGESATEGITLSSTEPSRDGYTFEGWCSLSTSSDSCTGVTYAAGATYNLNQTSSSNNITLYAIWKQAGGGALYDIVAAAWATEGSRVQTNDTDTSTGIQAAITTTNSGVFKYNPSTFGTSSDASNSKDIYFYRGILDTTTGSYGSDGDNAAHPNTVLLDANGDGADTSDTCWRIVRTTGSGGVKMIYQGKWTGSTCANAQAAAQVTTSAFNGTSATYQQIVRVGYTYNSTYATNSSKSGTIAQVFGSNSNPAANNTRSDIKTYIEDTWYAANMTKYTSMLEPSAGYCNDRTMNTTTSWTTPLAESTTIASTYGTSGQQAYYFGAYPRNLNAAQPPSLTCGNKFTQIDRSTVDLYRYNGTNGAAGSTTANYLKYPAALLTADEVSFAGSGSSKASQGSAYHANSYLRSGSYFWLLSPYARASNGYAYGFALFSNGILINYFVSNSYGVRPAISLASGTSASSGSGTAADPWVVTAP